MDKLVEANQRALDLQYMLDSAQQEVERLRSENNRINKLREAEINQAGAAERVYLEVMMVKDARIDLLDSDQKRYHAAWMAAEEDKEEQAARIKELEAALEDVGDCQSIAYMLGGKKKAEENKILIDYIERLEAAFLESETERKFYTTINGMNSEFDWNGYPECPQNGIHKEWFRQQARDVLKRIKEEREG